MVKKTDAKVDYDISDIIEDIESSCSFTKEDYLFLVKCLNEDYLEIKKKMEEIEDRYYNLKIEAQKRWYYTSSTCCLALAVSRKPKLPF